jgi:class 3 adenylate cyclase
VLCADISGFTAWASIRQPSQVFTLLESIYKEFDTMANKRRVFKVRDATKAGLVLRQIVSLIVAKLGPARQVETVGDCYVAVAGLPDPRKDHAAVMARFANDCVNKMMKLVEILEVALGPDTADLS